MRKNLISSLILVITLAVFSMPVWAGTGETPDVADTAMQPNPDEADEAMGPPPGE